MTNKIHFISTLLLILCISLLGMSPEPNTLCQCLGLIYMVA